MEFMVTGLNTESEDLFKCGTAQSTAHLKPMSWDIEHGPGRKIWGFGIACFFQE